MRLARLLAVALLAGLALLQTAESQNPDADVSRSPKGLERLQQQHRELHAALAESLEGVAQFCESQQLSESAAEIRKQIVPLDLNDLHAVSPPRQVQAELPADLPAAERQWRADAQTARREYATELYLHSRRALRAGFPSYAFQLVREVAVHDPDHASARRLLGYERYKDEWVTPFAASMLRQRKVWHERFGWLLTSQVERYEQGERFASGRGWISAEKEAEFRQDFANAWEIRTDHFLVKTNHSLERGVELGASLEQFHRYFVQTFAAFFDTPEQMRRLFENGGARSRGSAKPFEVHFYRTQEEYIQRLQTKYPQIAITNGLYDTGQRIAFFFDNPDAQLLGTLFHEASHQLFAESPPRNRPIAEKADFWIVEGIACYVESFQGSGGQYSIGDPNHVRIASARQCYLVNDYYIPLREFTGMGNTEFQTHRAITRNYSQASGLAHFFMHYDNGRYRDALIEHIVQIYAANPARGGTAQSLEELTGVRYETLDRQYGEYVRGLGQRSVGS